MNDKVVTAKGSRTVVSQRVKYAVPDVEALVVTALGSIVLSMLFVSMPLMFMAGWTEAMAFLGGFVSWAALMASMFIYIYASDIADTIETYSTSKISVFKTLMKLFLPLGLQYKTGVSKVYLSSYNSAEGKITRLVANPKPGYSESTHDVVSRVRFTPWGAYVEQEFTALPAKTWDDAFKATTGLHAFSQELTSV